ncbi:MAG: Ger(x)C family spore germination protein [Firmicutes bacterium]|nr:Ger(x)C family spore germination protein [Bacillota bacterium]
MIKKLSCFLCVLLLSGCWDERQYKDFALASMVGHDGQANDLISYFSIPIIIGEEVSSIIVKGEGRSTREVRIHANSNTPQNLDVSKLSVLLYSDETLKTDFYQFLDVYFRTAHNRLSTLVGMTEGSTKPYIEIGNSENKDAGTYYDDFIKGLANSSIYPETDLQTICTILFDDGMDLTLPYFHINEEENTPKTLGVALFTGRIYSGTYLNVNQARLLTILKDEIGRYTDITYTYEGIPVSIEVKRVNRKWDFKQLDRSGKVTMSYDLIVDVQEFSADRLEDEKERKELEKYLSKRLQEDTIEMIEVLQQTKSDPIGIGRRVRAFHPKVWEKGKWADIFSELTIDVKYDVQIKRTGILF